MGAEHQLQPGVVDLERVRGQVGEAGGFGVADLPTFTHQYFNGKTMVKEPPAKSNGTGQQDRNLWALAVSLDVEWAHAIAPQANILLVTTNPAETLGVQRSRR